MSDIYGSAATTDVAINTSNVSNTGVDVCQYSKDLNALLDEFEGVMSRLTQQEMSGYMSDSAFSAYTHVRDSLYGYATQIGTVGATIQQSAQNLSTAAQTSGDSIGVY